MDPKKPISPRGSISKNGVTFWHHENLNNNHNEHQNNDNHSIENNSDEFLLTKEMKQNNSTQSQKLNNQGQANGNQEKNVLAKTFRLGQDSQTPIAPNNSSTLISQNHNHYHYQPSGPGSGPGPAPAPLKVEVEAEAEAEAEAEVAKEFIMDSNTSQSRKLILDQIQMTHNENENLFHSENNKFYFSSSRQNSILHQIHLNDNNNNHNQDHNDNNLNEGAHEYDPHYHNQAFNDYSNKKNSKEKEKAKEENHLKDEHNLNRNILHNDNNNSNNNYDANSLENNNDTKNSPKLPEVKPSPILKKNDSMHLPKPLELNSISETSQNLALGLGPAGPRPGPDPYGPKGDTGTTSITSVAADTGTSGIGSDSGSGSGSGSGGLSSPLGSNPLKRTVSKTVSINIKDKSVKNNNNNNNNVNGIPSAPHSPLLRHVSRLPPPSKKKNSLIPPFLRSPSVLLDMDGRINIDLNNSLSNASRHFPSNVIRTSKYTVLTFLPINLFEQFRRLANFYFLVVLLVQTIPGVTPYPIYTSAAPLAFILVVGMLNEIREDFVRHKEDNAANTREVNLLLENGSGVVNPSTSAQVCVGQILKVHAGEEFPADLILLASHHEDGTCYVNTANLDGEAAPKPRYSPPATMNLSASELSSLKGVLKCETPSTSLYHFQGSLILNSSQKNFNSNSHDNENEHAIGDKQLLLRGSKLVNTDFVFGLVVYVGAETKMILNRNPAQFKFAHFEQRLNSFIFCCLAINIVVCIIGALVNGLSAQSFPNSFGISLSGLDYFKNFLTQFILFSFMVPISLYVTIELVKVGQAMFMEWDNGMSYTDPDTKQFKRALVKSAALNEELGLVDCICSDKTGTLTANKMELSRCSVSGGLYFDKPQLMLDHALTSPIHARVSVYGNLAQEPKLMIDLCKSAFRELIDNFDGTNDEVCKARGETARHFIFCILLCNAVLPQKKDLQSRVNEKSQGNTVDNNVPIDKLEERIDFSDEISFGSQSPDEIAFCEALARVGVLMLTRSGRSVTIQLKLPGMKHAKLISYEVLATLEFSSSWRRMSVVVKDPLTNRIFLYVKGADTTMQKLVNLQDPLENTQWDIMAGHAKDFGSTGSRTLVMIGKPLTDEEFNQWFTNVYRKAELSLSDRDSAIEVAFRSIEVNLKLLGCTAVDDQLQENVPECVDFLIQAKVKIIVVTGDKMETAITIARQCHLIQSSARLLHVAGLSRVEVANSLNEALAVVQTMESSNNLDEPPRFALSIDGVAQELALYHHPKLFLSIFKKVETVICYRSTPIQKALVVKFVKAQGLNCLAIGDGANDVSMIQESHVGVGILGKEGAHAAMSADFVIQRFSHLKRLLAIHGRYNFHRTGQVVLFSLYKSFALPLPLFWFIFWSLGSGQVLYDSLLFAAYNTFFTSLPPFFVGLMDKDVQEHVLLSIPLAYNTFKRESLFTWPSFLQHILFGTYHSIVIFFLAYGQWFDNELSSSGRSNGIWFIGNAMLTASCLINNVMMLFWCAHITVLNIVGLCIGFLIFSIIFIAASNVYFVTFAADTFGVGLALFSEGSTWLYLCLALVCAVGPIIGWIAYRKQHIPLSFECLQYLESIPVAEWPFEWLSNHLKEQRNMKQNEHEHIDQMQKHQTTSQIQLIQLPAAKMPS